MRRQSAVTTVSIGYAIYCVAILSRGLLTGVVRPRGHLSPWFICAILALLAYGMITKQRWARSLGLFVGVAGSFLWSLVIVWLYAFSGFSSRSGETTFFSWAVWASVPPLLLSIETFCIPIADGG
jgi:hypothetical protein